MKVWVALVGDGSGGVVPSGVFSTKERAQAEIGAEYCCPQHSGEDRVESFVLDES